MEYSLTYQIFSIFNGSRDIDELCDYIDVLGPGQIFRYIHAQDLKVVDFLHCHLINEDSLVDPQPSPSQVNNRFCDLAHFESKIVVLAPFNQITNLSPVLWHILVQQRWCHPQI